MHLAWHWQDTILEPVPRDTILQYCRQIRQTMVLAGFSSQKWQARQVIYCWMWKFTSYARLRYKEHWPFLWSINSVIRFSGRLLEAFIQTITRPPDGTRQSIRWTPNSETDRQYETSCTCSSQVSPWDNNEISHEHLIISQMDSLFCLEEEQIFSLFVYET